MKLIGYDGLGDLGDCSEGVALQIKNGRRYLYIAHLFAWGDFSVVDVTDPRSPKVVNPMRAWNRPTTAPQPTTRNGPPPSKSS